MLNPLAWSALVKIAMAFGLILVLQRWKLPLSICILVGGATMGLLMGMTPLNLLIVSARSAVALDTISLLAIISIIMVLSRLMEDSGRLDRIVSSFNNAVGNPKVALVVMPALIGLLPMPGGALFSAPMVETACGGDDVDAETKTAINYWFRHVWEYWWPLYPGMILAVSLLGVETWKFVLVQLPYTAISVLIGVFFLLRKLPPRFSRTCRGAAREKGDWRPFFREARPIALIVLAMPAVNIFEAATGWRLPPLSPMFIGLGGATFEVIHRDKVPIRQIYLALLNRNSLHLLLVIAAVMVFQGILLACRAADGVQADMASFGIPALVIILMVPFLSGLITGVAVGFVGVSFPLVVPLIAQQHGLHYLFYGSLAFLFGHMGQMLSPVHICLLVTRDYFSSKTLPCYGYIIQLAGTILVTGLVLLGILEALT